MMDYREHNRQDERTQADIAREWWERHGKDLPPPEPRPQRAVELQYNAGFSAGEADDVPPPPPRTNATDATKIKGYDAELGLVADDLQPAPERPEVPAGAAERWVRIATDVIRMLGPTSAYGPHLPVSRLDEPDKLPKIPPSILAALPELEALHRRLRPGWREIVLGWFQERRRQRLEERYRAEYDKKIDRVLRQAGIVGERQEVTHDERWELVRLHARRLRGRMPIVNTMPPRHVPSAADLLATLRRNPAELMGDIPEGLTAEILEALGSEIGGGRSGGYKPEKALELAEKWAADPKLAAREIARKRRAKETRRRRK